MHYNSHNVFNIQSKRIKIHYSNYIKIGNKLFM
jgi:hypothetical protein